MESYITNTSLVTTIIMTMRAVETLTSLSDQLLVEQGQPIDARFINYWFNDILSRR